jgi:hypothetical protein
MAGSRLARAVRPAPVRPDNPPSGSAGYSGVRNRARRTPPLSNYSTLKAMTVFLKNVGT